MANLQFSAKVRELIRQSRQIEAPARRRILELLDEARKRIAGELAGMDPLRPQAVQLRQLRSSIDAAFEHFRQQATITAQALERQGFEFGVKIAEQPLDAGGLRVPVAGQGLTGVSRNTLQIAQDFTADLISNLSRDAAGKVNAALQRAFLGGQKLTDIIEQVAEGLGGKGPLDIFSKVGERAVNVTINEIKRGFSIAGQARMEELGERFPEMRKQWRWVNVGQEPRMDHRLAPPEGANGQIQRVDEPFLVAGEELMFPRDPNGSAENTINCHCISVPYFDADAFKPSERQKTLLRDLGIEISVDRAA